MRDETEINKEYAQLILKLQENKEKRSKDLESTLISLMHESDLLFTKIKKPSSLKLDALLMNDSTFLSSKNLEKSIENTEANLDTFMELLITDNLDGYLKIAKKHFYGVNFYKTLALNVPTVREGRNAKPVMTETEPEKAEIVTQNEQLDANMEIPHKIKNVLERVGELEYFRLVIDVDSYGKTIENIFYLAFAIKQKMCSLKTRDGKIFVSNEYVDSEANNHIILELTYSDYDKIKQKSGIKESLI